MRVLVTGSNGFVGKNLINELAKQFEDITIHCLVRRPQETQHPRISYFNIDYLNLDSLLSSQAFTGIDTIFHVAGVTKSHTARGFIEGNVIPTENLIKTIRQKQIKLNRFVLISSQAAGGPAENIDHYTTEDDPDNPVDAYGKSKLAAEQILKAESSWIPYTIIRPGAVYGPYDVDFFNVFKMAQSHFSIFAGIKDKYVSLVFIEDLIRAILDATWAEITKNKLYYICDDRAISWKEIHDAIFQITGKKKMDISLPFTPIFLASYLGSLYGILTGKASIFNHHKVSFSKPKYWIASSQRAKADFNYQSRYHYTEGFAQTYQWYKENGWL
jgi:dihydroflavonol-4-reductase